MLTSGGRGWTRRDCLLGAGAIAAGVTSARSQVLVNATAAPERGSAGPIPVAILLGPNATLIDFAGPWEILGGAAYSCAGFNAYSVAATNRIGRVFSREMAMTVSPLRGSQKSSYLMSLKAPPSLTAR
jgi:hypothetical protein